MKRFVGLVLLFFLFVIGIKSVLLIWSIHRSHETMIHSIPPNVVDSSINYLVLGPSNGLYAWNDSIIPHSINACISASEIGVSYNQLLWYKELGYSFDTLVLCASQICFTNYFDKQLSGRINGRTHYMFYLPFYHYDFFNALCKYSRTNPKIMVYPLTVHHTMNSFLADYSQYEGFKEVPPTLDRKYARYEHTMFYGYYSQIYGDPKTYTSAVYRRESSMQIYYLKKIVRYCIDNHLTLVILSTPVVSMPLWENNFPYRELLSEELGDSALIADYSGFVFPDTTYYVDLVHLSKKGADLWSRHIADSGLRLQYVVDYCK